MNGCPSTPRAFGIPPGPALCPAHSYAAGIPAASKNSQTKSSPTSSTSTGVTISPKEPVYKLVRVLTYVGERSWIYKGLERREVRGYWECPNGVISEDIYLPHKLDLK